MRLKFLFSTIYISFSMLLSAQEVQFESYTVQKSQTLYSLSKQFGITQEEIIKYNPDLQKSTLKAGQVLRIPQKTQTPPVQPQNAAENPAWDYSPSFDEPQKREINLWQLEKLFSSKNAEPQPLKIATDSINLHIIKPKETLFSISKQYGIFPEDIINANPRLESVLTIGDTIFIPRTSVYEPHPTDSLYIKEFNVIKIAFLLPFSNSTSDASNDRFLEFYTGALLAVNRAKQRGISFEIYTFNTDRTESQIADILQNTNIKTVDLIIGPAYSNQVQAVAEFARTHKIYTLVPFSSKVQEIAVNPYLLQFNPSSETEQQFTFNQLNNSIFRNANIIFVQPAGADVSDDGWAWAAGLQNILTKNSRNFLQVEWTDASNKSVLQNVVKQNVKNIVFFMSNKFSVIQPYLSVLSAVSAENTNTSLFVQYSWLHYSFQHIEILYIAPFENLLVGAENDTYNREFARFFNWKPTTVTPRYDLLGFDLTNCFVNQLFNFGKNFGSDKTAITHPNGIQSVLNFERKDLNAGFENKKLYLKTSVGQ